MPIEIHSRPLEAAFYDARADDVARRLLGKSLIRRSGSELVGGIIVETEAYLSSDDPASHSHRGPTNRNRAMFGPPGTLYVYTIHAKYCLNAVTEPTDIGSAVLIRALEPLWGISTMQARRCQTDLRRLCRGPAMLCQALDVDLRLNGHSLCDTSELWIEAAPEYSDFPIRIRPRIGIRHAAELHLRYFIDGNQYVSGRVADHSRKITPG